MEWLQIKDNAEGNLANNIDVIATEIPLQTGQGEKFPTGNFVVTTDNEKMHCSARTGDVLTVTRGYDGTEAADHIGGTKIQLRVIGEHITEIRDQVDLNTADIEELATGLSDEITAREQVQTNLDDHAAYGATHFHEHDHMGPGSQGGNLSASSIVSNEIPGGLINGSNQDFTTAAAYLPGSLRVFRNGIRLKGGGNDYTEVGQGFTMVTAPAANAVLLVDYATKPSVFNTGSTSFIYSELCGGTPDGIVTAFTTAFSYVPLSTVVFLDGIRMRRGVDYTESAAQQITFSSAPATGSEILIDYQKAVSAAGNADTLDGFHAGAGGGLIADMLDGAHLSELLKLTDVAIVTANGNRGIRIGNLVINFGVTAVASSGTSTTYAIPISAVYSAVATVHDTNNQTAWITSPGLTTIAMKQLYTGNPLNVGWIVIGAA
jgi:hypothetical protein